MMRDLSEFLSELHSKVDIVEVVSRYVKLRKQGANFVGLCPFHKEKTPSFVVSPAKQIFHCFGCGVSGDVVKFVTMIENSDFKEAVLKLSEEAGIQPPAFRKPTEKSSDRDEIFSFNLIAAQYFNKNLSKEVSSYLKEKRRLKDETIERFMIGNTPSEYSELLALAKEQGFSDAILTKSGLFRRTERGELFPYFRNRIMFPIFSIEGKVAGFSGRSFDGSEPKYLNTPETDTFRKGSILYGLNFAKEEIRKTRSAIVVEGYFDVIVLFQEGIRNVVSPMGTSFTEEQAKLLGRFAEKAFFFFDSDTGGRTGAERAIETCGKTELQPMIIVSEKELDPDEIALESGIEEILNLSRHAKDPVLFIAEFESSVNDNTPQGKAKTIEKLIEVFSKISKKTVVYEYLKQVSKQLDIDIKFLVDEYNNYMKKTSRRSGDKSKLEIKTDKYTGMQKILTQAMIQRPETIESILTTVSVEKDFEEPFRRIALRAISDIATSGKIDVSMWTDLPDEDYRTATALALEDESLVLDVSLNQTLKAFREFKFYSEEIKRLFDEMRNATDENIRFEKLREYNMALKRIKEG